ncbi:MAG TPA: carboxylate-amine ligase [Ktedonobacteraceae bacterium]
MDSAQQHFTLGVEEEYQIIHPDTYELSSSSKALLSTAQQALGELAQPELQLSQIEAATPICQDVQEVRTQLVRMRQEMLASAVLQGKTLAASGTHPFSERGKQRITPKARYREIAEDFQQLAHDAIFGCHVHIGLDDREMALQVMNRARPWLAPLLALSASSPFWLGQDTGYASFRTILWSRWPTAGQPRYFASLDEYDALLQSLVVTGCIEDASKIYWDIRLSEHFKTLEFRVADCCLTIDEAVMMAGLVQALVKTCYEQEQRQTEFPLVSPELLRAAHWRAARYGLSHELIDVGEQRSLPAAVVIEKMLVTLRPALEDEGNWDEIAFLVNQTLRLGNGTLRQHAAYQEHGRLEEVVAYIVAETSKGIA